MLQRIAGDRRGNVAMLFAGALVPTIAVVGIAVDFARASLVRTQLQAAVDAAAMSGATTPGAVVARESAASSTFDANAGGVASSVRVEKFITATSGSVYVKAEAEVPTAFMKLVGQEKMAITAESTVSNGGKKLELALVLDTTGSMAWNNKLQELQQALPTILDIVMPPGHDNTRVSVIPFATYVNVGSNNTQELTGRTDWPNARCVLERKRGDRPNESPPDLYQDEFWIQTSNSSCSNTRPITPLTNNRTVLENALSDLNASGSTAGHLGIQWGWHTISPLWADRWPSGSAPKPYTDESVVKALVILTDGNFTDFHIRKNGSSPNCNGSADCPDSRFEAKAYCDQIKTRMNSYNREAVMIFTIGFGLEPEWTYDGQKARETMIHCASYDETDPETDLTKKRKHFYFPVTKEDLQLAFRAIGDAVSEATSKPRFTN